MKKNLIEDVISLALEDMYFEDILEMFDLSPSEVFVLLYQAGKIDEEVLENLANTYAIS